LYSERFTIEAQWELKKVTSIEELEKIVQEIKENKE